MITRPALPFLSRTQCLLRRRLSGDSLSRILQQVRDGSISLNEAEESILRSSSPAPAAAPGNALESFANLDHSRSNRTGFPEAVFGAGKTPEQVATILDDMAGHLNAAIKQGEANTGTHAILATRIDADLHKKIASLPLKNGTISYHDTARIIAMKANLVSETSQLEENAKRIVVACAGTTDLPVAEEAAVTLEASGCSVHRVYDVGVAGLHRIIQALPHLQKAQCVIVCAGMDGALPSVVGGLVKVPVIAVPTSVGYGASFSGVSALLTMLNSCAPGVGVVNIDNGFGAAALAFKCVKR